MCRIENVNSVYNDLTMVETRRKIHRSTLLGMLMRCDDEQIREITEKAERKKQKLLLRHVKVAAYLKAKGALPMGAHPDKVE